MMKGEEMKEIKIGMLGFGTVGTGVVRVLRENEREITAKAGVKLTLKSVLVRDAKKERPYMEGLHLTENVDEILNDEEIDIVIELLGGIHPAREYMLVAMEKGKNVVTANKDVVAQFGKDMFEAMEKYGVDFHFEASVGGGIPIVMPLKQCLTANRVTEIMGIINGTTNYMLSQMAENGSDYDSVLKEAQAKGYAEANPAADVEGLDAARKIAILASIAFNTRIRFEDVSVEGITKVTPEDIEYAKALGLRRGGRRCARAPCIPAEGASARLRQRRLQRDLRARQRHRRGDVLRTRCRLFADSFSRRCRRHRHRARHAARYVRATALHVLCAQIALPRGGNESVLLCAPSRR